MESPFYEMDNEIEHLKKQIEILKSAVPVWKSVRIDGFPNPALEYTDYIVAVELRDRYTVDAERVVCSAQFVSDPGIYEYVIDGHWIPTTDLEEGNKIIKVLYWLEYPEYPQ